MLTQRALHVDADGTRQGRLYQTVDGGKSWEWRETVPQASIYDSFGYDGRKSLYLAMGFGSILKYTDASYASRGRRVKGSWRVAASGKRRTVWGDVKRLTLYPNFPNPANPETWIPYTLAEPGRVMIRIYDGAGHLVRAWPLGYKQAGQYLDKPRAIRWDGRNQTGELVGSGVYFYQLQAGGFVAIRRMLLVR